MSLFIQQLIREERKALQHAIEMKREALAKDENRLKELQEECKHPRSTVKYIEYDSHIYHCPDCDKGW